MFPGETGVNETGRGGIAADGGGERVEVRMVPVAEAADIGGGSGETGWSGIPASTGTASTIRVEEFHGISSSTCTVATIKPMQIANNKVGWAVRGYNLF